MRPRLRPERVRPRLRLRPNDLALRPHVPQGLNIPGYVECLLSLTLSISSSVVKIIG